MWSRKRIDIAWSELAAAATWCATSFDGESAQAAVEAAWGANGQSLACLSVRSGWDLLLGEANFPRGSEVLVSAITIPGMARIVEAHGLVAVPLDLDPRTALPDPIQIVDRTTSRTRAVLVAHLFGASGSLSEHIAAARARGLMFIEDCAQAYRGEAFRGHDAADVSMFSFGPIKPATALGGAMVCVRNPDLLARMRGRQSAYPRQSRAAYLGRIGKYAGLKGLSSRAALSMLLASLRLVGRDHDFLLNSFVRGFPRATMLDAIRHQPGAPLLQLMRRRIEAQPTVLFDRRAARGHRLAEALAGAYECPTASLEPHGFWVFPLLTDDPAGLRKHLLRNGFDATQGNSLIVVPPPRGREDLAAVQAERLLSRLIFLPFYDALPDRELHRLADVLHQFARPVVTGSTVATVAPRAARV